MSRNSKNLKRKRCEMDSDVESDEVKIWIKEKHHKRPTEFNIKSEDNVVALLKMLINNEDFSSYWVNPKPRDLDVILNGKSLQHDMTMGTLQATVTADQCLVVQQDDIFLEKLTEYNIKPSAFHDARTITKLVPKAKSFWHFTCLVKSLFQKMPLDNLDENLFKSFETINKCFEFERNENSVSLQVAIMLSCVLQKFENYKAIPFHNLQIIPEVRKRGHPYQTDFVIKASSSSSDEDVEEPFASTSTNVNDEVAEQLCACTDTDVTTVKREDSIVMVIEVKKSVATNFLQIDMQDAVEMLIYCYYVIRIYNQVSTVGVLTDGYTWHCLYLLMPRGTDTLEVMKYTVISSDNEKAVLNSIPSLIRFAD